VSTQSSVQKLSRTQRQIVSLSWVTYAAYYLGRVNISTALPAMQEDLGLLKSDVGLITTGFFWAYALGQLVNGPLGDRISPRKFIFVGLLGSAAINLIFGSLSIWLVLLLLWSINGYFQATGWGPTLRTLANWLSPEQRTRVSGVFGSSFVAGNALTWLLSGWLVSQFGWRQAFWVPGVLMIGMALIWRTFSRDQPEDTPETQPDVAEKQESILAGVLPSLRQIWTLALASVCLGFVLITLFIWMPTFFVEVGQLEIGRASYVSSLLPFAGIGGTVLVGWISGRYWIGREARGLALVLGLLAIGFVTFPLWSGSLLTTVAVLMLIGAGAYGASSLLLSTMALVHGGHVNASRTAGLVDFSFNIGAGLSGGVIGALLNNQPWTVVFYILAAASLASGFFVLLPMLKKRT
jgi:OPA family glycerol-3-phosphate transporter-like MFS transporter